MRTQLLLLALVAVPNLVSAQGNLSYRSAPQVVIDHFKPDNTGSSLGTNVGVGMRWYNALTDNLHGYGSVTVFENLGGAGGFISNAYVEGIVSLMISPRGVKNGAAPYFGGGGALLAAAGLNNAGSPLVLAGVNFISSDRIPYVELQYFTRGGRISAVFGLFF